MSAELEQRVACLERELIDLKKFVQGGTAEKDWRTTFGMSRDDPGFEEMVRLGREIREQSPAGGA
jgi:hypothetical protein